MPDPPIDPLAEPPAPIRTPRSTYRTCDFCGCQLTDNGEVYRMSDQARAINKHTDTIAQKNEAIATLEREIATLKARVTELTPQAARSIVPTFT